MRGNYRPTHRDRAFRRVVYWTAGGVAGAAGLTGAISAASAASFAAAAPKATVPVVPIIPVEVVPSQSPAPTAAVIVQVIHVAGATVSRGGAAISPPRQAPGTTAPVAAVRAPGSVAPPPPPAPPPPVCHSTPSHPC